MDRKPKDPQLVDLLRADTVIACDEIDRLMTAPPAEPTVGRWLVRGEAFERDGKTVAFLAQPYSVSGDDLAEILALCERHDLRVEISMKSEWEPGQTLGILFWHKNLNPFVPPHLLNPKL